ncbi:MAG: protein kinase [Proteobacteria bacterium]|nr:protein kinase [Pseudomonadota bacterium]
MIGRQRRYYWAVPITNLPRRLDVFVGRAAELNQLESLLEGGACLVTILGTGGTGKTRLSQQFATSANYDGGVWFCDLSEAQDADGIVYAVASAFDLTLTGDPVEQLKNVIVNKGRVLVILDNFEQVVDHASATVGAWLQAAPESQFIVTSRTRLGLEGEHILPLHPLILSDAIELFERRVQAGTGCHPGESHRAIVADIVNQLDCIPLALELAAGRARLLSLAQIRQHLKERFKLLVGGPTSRQGTLWATIDWSWQQLEPLERHTLTQCSVFHNGFTIESAEKVLDFTIWPDAPWTLDVLSRLLDHCLLHKAESPDGLPRFRVYESIREYAAQQMNRVGAIQRPDSATSLTGPDQAQELCLRHARHFSELGTVDNLQSLEIRGGQERRQALAAELENLRAAFDFASESEHSNIAALCALAMACHYLSYGISPGLALLCRAVDLPNLDKPILGELHLWLGKLSSFTSDNNETHRHLLTAMAIARQEGNLPLEGKVNQTLGFLARRAGRLDEARTHHQVALSMHRNERNHQKVGRALSMLGCIENTAGRPNEARSCLAEALSIQRMVGDVRGEMGTLAEQAALFANLGMHDEALGRYTKAATLSRSLGEHQVLARVLTDQADQEMRNGHFDLAKGHLEEATALAQAVGNQYVECISRGNLGELLLRQNHTKEAELHLQGAIEKADDVSSHAAGAFRGTLALCRAQQEDFSSARELLLRGEELLQSYPLELGILLCKAVRVERRANNADGAATILANAKKLAEDQSIAPGSEFARNLATLDGTNSSSTFLIDPGEPVAAARPDRKICAGTRIERYVVESLVGNGAMATVFKVRHQQLNSVHALKVLFVRTHAVERRLLQEGMFQGQLQHPNIVMVTDVVDINGSPGLIMELIAGPSLAELLKEGKLKLNQADALAIGILKGVRAAHQAGVVHRDLKPANILLQVTNVGFHPKIADFGLSKLILQDEDEGLTRSGVTMGTPCYMAPEQIRDSKRVDERADIFSLGAILFELVTGQRAFVGSDNLEILQNVASGRRQPLEKVASELPHRIVKAINGALEIDRDKRIPTVDELLHTWSASTTEVFAPSKGVLWDAELLERMRGIDGEFLPKSQGLTIVLDSQGSE